MHGHSHGMTVRRHHDHEFGSEVCVSESDHSIIPYVIK